MLRLAIKLGILLAPFLIFFTWAEFRLSSMPNSYSQKLSLLEKTATNIEVLVLGSSHALYGINPSLFRYAGINMAQHAQSVYYDTKILLRWGSRLPRLKLVIFPISYFSLEWRPEGVVDRTVFYRRYYDISSPLDWSQLQLHRFSIFATYGLKSSIDCLFSGLPPKELLDSSLTDTGWLPGDRKDISTNQGMYDTNGVERVHYHESVMDDKYKNQNIAYLRQPLTWCKNNQIIAVFITTPVTRSYFKYIDKKRSASMKETIHQLCIEYGANYFDFESDGRFTQQDFQDIDHLNSTGAGKFSAIIDREVLAPLIKQ